MDLIDFAKVCDEFGVRLPSHATFVEFYEAIKGTSTPLSLAEKAARDKDVVALMVDREKIKAIKLLRDTNRQDGILPSLREAKDAVESPEVQAAVDKAALDALREKLIGSLVPYEEPVPHYESDPFGY